MRSSYTGPYKMAAVSIRLNPVGVIIILAVLGCVGFYMFGGLSWFKSEQKISMKQLLSVSIELAKRGGQRVKEVKDGQNMNAESKGLTEEGKKELKTNGDLQSHRAIVYGFNKAFPGLKVISEEHETKPINFKEIPDSNKDLAEVNSIIDGDDKIAINDITVWIDPLDATQEYTESLTQYVTVMVCVAVQGRARIGVIHKPFLTGEEATAWAWEGYGMSKNIKVAKQTSQDKPEDPKKIIVSRAHQGDVRNVTVKTFGEKTVVIPAGGAGYKVLEVINGNADAYVHVTAIKKWDICAGNAILNAVKGKMTTLEGEEIDYSKSDDPKNHMGLLSTLYDHSTYLGALKEAANDLKEKYNSL